MNKKELVRDYIKKKRYFSLSQIVGDIGLKRKLTKDYLSQLKLEGAVFDAGYGCFSSIPKRFIFPHVERVILRTC